MPQPAERMPTMTAATRHRGGRRHKGRSSPRSGRGRLPSRPQRRLRACRPCGLIGGIGPLGMTIRADDRDVHRALHGYARPQEPPGDGWNQRGTDSCATAPTALFRPSTCRSALLLPSTTSSCSTTTASSSPPQGISQTSAKEPRDTPKPTNIKGQIYKATGMKRPAGDPGR